MSKTTITRADARMIAEEVVRLQQEMTQPRLVPAKEAAEILGISVAHLRHIKDRLPYIKRGEKNQARLLFDASRIRQAYTEH